MQSHLTGAWVSEEMNGLSLPDKRFNNNILAITERLADGIGKSFSGACGDPLRKSAWRLFSRKELSLLEVHHQQTFARCAKEDTVLVVEDTTDISYIQKGKQGMGVLGGSKKMDLRGLNMHTAMALTTDGASLGIIHQQIWAPESGRDRNTYRQTPIEEKESFKWITTLRAVGALREQAPDRKQTFILTADREADFFEHYGQPRQQGVELLVRVRDLKRKVYYNDTPMKIGDVASQLAPQGCGMVKVWRRGTQKQRVARVTYYSAAVRIPPPYGHTLPEQTMYLVCISEKSRSQKDAINWLLLSTIPVVSLADAVSAARYYSLRWVIERFHLILKSGLKIEKLQLDNFTRLHNALQLYALIGWHMLWLYRLGQCIPEELAMLHFEQDSIEVLAAVSGKQIRVVKDFLIEVGRLGGFIPSKKQPLPGEKTLWIGMSRFIPMAKAFAIAKQKYGTG